MRTRPVAMVAGAGLVVAMVVLAAPAAEAATSSTGQRCTITGTAGADRLVGTSRNDVICGLGGNDTISGGGGNDVLDGGAGNDSLSGGLGNDRIVGGTGNDTVSGGSGNDRIAAGDGNDTLAGDAGNDALDAGNGSDSISGGSGADHLVGGRGEDTLSGGSGGDDLDGNAGDDALSGDGGSDALDGGAGSNSCETDSTDTQALACLYDSTPPTFDRAEVLTSAVDSSQGAGLVRIRIHILDDLSGLGVGHYVGVACDGCASNGVDGAVRVYGQLTYKSGTRRDSVWEAVVRLTRVAVPGSWQLADIQLTDWGGNSSSFRTPVQIATVNAPGAVTAFTVTNRSYVPPVAAVDTTRPVVTDVAVTPTVDVTDHEAVVDISATVTDTGSGVDYAYTSVYRSGGLAMNLGTALRRSTGSTWIGTMPLIANSDAGTYSICVTGVDKAGNRQSGECQRVAVVSAHPDVTPPQLVSVVVATPVITKRVSLGFRLSVTVTDDSGVAECPQIGIYNPNGNASGIDGWAPDAPVAADGGRTLTCTYTGNVMPAAMAGDYRVVYVGTRDRGDHQGWYVPSADFVSTGMIPPSTTVSDVLAAGPHFTVV